MSDKVKMSALAAGLLAISLATWLWSRQVDATPHGTTSDHSRAAVNGTERVGMEPPPGGTVEGADRQLANGLGIGQPNASLAMSVRVIDEAGELIPAARIAIVRGVPAPPDSNGAREWMRSIETAKFSVGVLELESADAMQVVGDERVWVCAKADGFEHVIVSAASLRQSSNVVLRRLVTATCRLDRAPTEGRHLVCVAVPFLQNAQKWLWGQHINPLPTGNGWCVVSHAMSDVADGRAEIQGLVRGQQYAFYVMDDETSSERQFATAPCSLLIATPNGGLTPRLVFTRPIPHDGVVCWVRSDAKDTMWDSRDIKEGLAELLLSTGVRGCGIRVFGIGQGWSFSSPIDIASDRQDVVVKIVDDSNSVFLPGVSAGDVIVKEWLLLSDGPTLAAVPNGETQSGLRCWATPGGIVVRGVHGKEQQIVFDWSTENALTAWPRKGEVVSRPRVVPVQLKDASDMHAVKQALRVTTSTSCKWWLEQRVSYFGKEVWCEVATNRSPTLQVMEEIRAEKRMVDGVYRLRVTVDHHEFVLMVE